MHRDTKIGLATGILILGIVGAFCFRKVDDVPQTALELKSVQSINDQLARKSLRPYLDDEQARDREQRLPDEDWTLSEETISYTGDVPAPNPIPPSSDNAYRRRPPIVGIVEAGKSGDSQTATGNGRSNAAAAQLANGRVQHSHEAVRHQTASIQNDQPRRSADAETIHVVQNGETLSAISLKYYGTSHRYQQIFEANSKSMSSPNALKPGMKIVIPSLNSVRFPNAGQEKIATTAPESESKTDKVAARVEDPLDDQGPGKSASAKSASERSHSDKSKSDDTDNANKPKRLFKPARKSPFVMRPRTAAAIQDEPGESDAKQ